jgi:hypothetical protein
VLEQPAFALQAAGVAGEGAALADHAVAGDDDRDRVAAVGEADGAAGARHAEAGGELAVAGGGAERDRAQRAPHALLERGTAGTDREQVERARLAREEGGERVADRARNVAVAKRSAQQPPHARLVVGVVERTQRAVAIADHQQRSQR